MTEIEEESRDFRIVILTLIFFSGFFHRVLSEIYLSSASFCVSVFRLKTDSQLLENDDDYRGKEEEMFVALFTISTLFKRFLK